MSCCRGWLLRGLAATAVLVSWIAPAPVRAMTVTPIHLEMTSVGAGSRHQISVVNDGNSPLPVELVLSVLSVGENGQRRLSSAGDEFMVFPAQSLIAPGATQSFRLQWVGEPVIDRSKSYMLSVNQIPVRLPKGQKGVQLVMSFGVQINVAPPQGLPSLVLVGAGTEVDKRTGQRHPAITVLNSSNVHALLPQANIKLSSGSWSKSLDHTFLGEKIGIGLVQPGKQRRFVLPFDRPPHVSQFQTSLEFKPRR